MTAFLLAAGGLFLLLALHPFVTYPLSLAALRRLRPRPLRPAPEPGAAPPSFSICVCAHNEAKVIRDKIENLLALRAATPGGLEILVYDDASSDGTGAILREAGGAAITVVTAPSRTGKTPGMNRLASLAKGEILVFSDANVTVEPEALARLERYFADPEVGCVCGHLLYLNRDRSVTAATGADYWQLEEWIKQLESDTGSVIGADGSLFAVRRSLHRPVPEDLIDDIHVSLGVLFQGRRVVRAPDVRAFENSATDARDEFRRKVRIACQAFNIHRRLWPQLKHLGPLDLYKYLSHKFLRWLTIYSLALAGSCFLAALIRLAGWPLGLGLAGLGALGLWLGHALKLPLLGKLADVLGAFVATGLGVIYSLRGREFRTWTPAASVRQGP
jgi:cellulose synthase/poly-beta-1,6-N-acetylglucosamine synthase-like glycosyltransferase